MKTILLSVGLLLVTLSISAQQVAKSLTYNGLFVGFYEYKPTSYGWSSTRKYPLMIFLHGVGERGNGTTDLYKVAFNGPPYNIAGGSKMAFTVNGVKDTFLVLSPQLSLTYTGWINTYTDAMYNYAISNLQVDPNRVYLTGLSAGGGGVWDYVTSDPTNAPKFAAIVVSCGVAPGNMNGICYMNQANLPVWAFHAMDDPTVPVGYTQTIIDKMDNSCTPSPDPMPLAKYYPSGGHGIWGWVYDETHVYQNPNVYEWMLMHTRASAPVDVAPVSKAGNDTIIVLPSNTASLNGGASYDGDGTIAEYQWTKVSGPDNYTITSPANSATTVTGMVTGTYQFVLRTLDYYGKAGYDTMTVDIKPGIGANIPPVANAGNDFSTTNNYAYLSGGGSYDPDGTIIAYNWKQITGPALTLVNAQTSFPTAQSIVGGVYKFQLTVYDNMGASASNFVTMTNPTGILPVEYLYVKATKISGKNTVQWATDKEINTDHFDVQRSEDGIVFTSVGSVKAAGSSTSTQEYTFTDNQYLKTKYLYRLLQVDKDGTIKFSKIVSVADNSDKGGATIYPNPVRESLNVAVNNTEKGNGVINVYSVDGKLIQHQTFYKSTTDYYTSINAQSFKAGIYLVEVSVGDKYKTVERMVKTN
jgi:poly(3-hydroxybutyrate) depolymerase